MYNFASTEHNGFCSMIVRFLAVVLLVSSLFLMAALFRKNIRFKELSDARTRLVPYVFMVEALLITSDILLGQELYSRLLFDIYLGTSALILLTSSLWDTDKCIRIVVVIISLMSCVVIWYVLSLFGILRLLGRLFFIGATAAVSISIAVLFIDGLWDRIKVVKAVMKSGTVWLCLSLAVDSLYVVLVLAYAVVYLVSEMVFIRHACLLPTALVFLAGGLMVALGGRVAMDSLFVLLHRHERRIVESMKITQIESAADSSNIDDQYKELYERIQEYFELKKPYLNGELTINDIVKAVYTNKLYISRAISQSTGRNFCQYVNYYRVTHSVQAFRANPQLKIHELANASGFNTVVSFNMAFRLFMGENPSDWCRKEKKRICRKKK